jgi:endonuclease III
MPDDLKVEKVDTSSWRLGYEPGSSPPARKRRGGSVERRIDAPIRGKLFQEDMLDEPFWLLLACSLVNLTNWETAQPIHAGLMARYSIEEIAGLDPEALQEDLRPLGLWRRRSLSTVRLARAWLAGPPGRAADVLKLPGCGQYASDSFAIFIEGRTDVDPTDGKLNAYLLTRLGMDYDWQRDNPDEAREALSAAARVQCPAVQGGPGLSAKA